MVYNWILTRLVFMLLPCRKNVFIRELKQGMLIHNIGMMSSLRNSIMVIFKNGSAFSMIKYYNPKNLFFQQLPVKEKGKLKLKLIV